MCLRKFFDGKGKEYECPACSQENAGNTPVKGVDYFTDADKAELVAAVLAALPDGTEVEY